MTFPKSIADVSMVGMRLWDSQTVRPSRFQVGLGALRKSEEVPGAGPKAPSSPRALGEAQKGTATWGS